MGSYTQTIHSESSSKCDCAQALLHSLYIHMYTMLLHNLHALHSTLRLAVCDEFRGPECVYQRVPIYLLNVVK